MPLFEYLCLECGKVSEVLLIHSDDRPACRHCQSEKVKKIISASSSASGVGGNSALPGRGDHTCCGHAPGVVSGCSGPGSCCGKA